MVIWVKFLIPAVAAAKLLQPCPTLCNPIDGSLIPSVPLIPPLPVGWRLAASLRFLCSPHLLIGEAADGYQIASIVLSSEIYLWKAGIPGGCDILVSRYSRKYLILHLEGVSCQDYPILSWDGINEDPSYFTSLIPLPSSLSKARMRIS